MNSSKEKPTKTRIELSKGETYRLYLLHEVKGNINGEWTATGSGITAVESADGKFLDISVSEVGIARLVVESKYGSVDLTLDLVPNKVPSVGFQDSEFNTTTLSGTVKNFELSVDDKEESAALEVYLKSNSTGDCSDGDLILSDSEYKAKRNFDVDTTALTDGSYYLCIKTMDPNGDTISYSSPFYIAKSGVCNWLGQKDSNWSDAENWVGCPDGSGLPQSSDEVLLLAHATNDLSITGTKAFSRFSLGKGGGRVILQEGSELRITATNNLVRSDVHLEGVDDCASCRFNSPTDEALTIVDGATLSIGKRVDFDFNEVLNVGSSSTAGHLVIDVPGALEGDRPGGLPRIWVEGPSLSNKSSLSANGITSWVNWCCYGQNEYGAILFIRNYDVRGLDNLTFYTGQAIYQESAIQLRNCHTASISDTHWEGLTFYSGGSRWGDSIKLQDCSGLPAGSIRVSEVGPRNGSVMDSDPNNILDWTDETATKFTCLFNGSVDSNFSNVANWSNCNDRSGLPDAFDDIVIPDGLELVVDGPFMARAIANSPGNASVKILSGGSRYLILRDSGPGQIRSNITLKAESPTCTSCNLYIAGHLNILGGELNLESGTQLKMGADRNIYVGNVTTYGAFKSIHSSGNKPMIAKYGQGLTYFGTTIVGGPSSTPSVIDFSGITYQDSPWEYDIFQFSNAYRITNFDNVTLNAGGSYRDANVFSFLDCTDADVVDLDWKNIYFQKGTYVAPFNFDVSGTNCDLISPISVQGSGPGAGAGDENDPFNKINWY
ncbi:MAG: hypothetical protein VX642_11825 [Bdellovibrionota bacterium]|nr:hypothetical protein [Bdellovibrionota bacterium]